MGWIRLHGFGTIEPKWIKTKMKLTNSQKTTINDWYIFNNKKFDF